MMESPVRDHDYLYTLDVQGPSALTTGTQTMIQEESEPMEVEQDPAWFPSLDLSESSDTTDISDDDIGL